MPQIPKVAVGVPVYNGENYLGDTLKQLLVQTYQDFEVIVSDNCSTDRTRELCLDYAAKDPRIVYSRTETNLGANPNFNRVSRLARSPYFCWRAHDDRVHPEYLKKCVAVLDANPDVVLSHAASTVVDDAGNPLRLDAEKQLFIYEPGGFEVPPDRVHIAEGRDPIGRFAEFLDETYFGMHVYGVVRREALAQTQLFRMYHQSERCILAELSLIGRFSTLDEHLCVRRVHAQSSCFMTQDERKAYGFTEDDGRKHLLPRLRAYAGAAVQSKAISPAQKAHCLALIAQATVQSRWRKFRRRLLPASPQPNKVVYQ